MSGDTEPTLAQRLRQEFRVRSWWPGMDSFDTARGETEPHPLAREAAEYIEQAPNMWDCPDCGFSFDARHEDVGGGYSCPVCAEVRLTAALRDLAEEYERLTDRTPPGVAVLHLPLLHAHHALARRIR